MNTNSENRLSRDLVLQQWLNDNQAALIAAIAILGGSTGSIAKFNAIMQIIIDAAAAAGVDITGYAVNKLNKRNALVASADLVSSIIESFASETEDAVLERMFHMPPSYLAGLRDSDLHLKSLSIFKKATEIDTATTPATPLAGYGLGSTDLGDLNTKIGLYLGVIQSPRMAQVTKSVSLDVLNANFNKAEVLIDKLKKQLAPLRQINSVLHGEFVGIILINDNAATHSSSPDAEGEVGNPSYVVVSLPAGIDIASSSFRIEISDGPNCFATFNSNPPTSLPGGLSAQVINNGTPRTLTSALLNYDAALRPELILFTDGDPACTYKLWVE